MRTKPILCLFLSLFFSALPFQASPTAPDTDVSGANSGPIVLARGTFSGLFEGIVMEEGANLQVYDDNGKRGYFILRDGKVPETVRGRVGKRLTIRYVREREWNAAYGCTVTRDIVEGLEVAAGPADAVLNQTRAKAEAYDSTAANILGVWYEKGRHGLPVDPQEAVSWYRMAATENPLAMHNLGDCYRTGTGVETNAKEALEWYRKAAQAGHPIGYEDLGDCYLNGVGVPANTAQAVEWYKKAAEKGRKSAQAKLAALEKGPRLAK